MLLLGRRVSLHDATIFGEVKVCQHSSFALSVSVSVKQGPGLERASEARWVGGLNGKRP